jgi:hypothetical protein
MKPESITRVTLESAKNLKDLTDWERLEKMSEAEVEENALADPDNQPISPDLTGLKRIKRNVSPQK